MSAHTNGWVNAHTHLYSALAPFGMPPPAEEPRNFDERLKRVWWRLDRALDASSLAAGARYYVAQALLGGTVGLVDHHESPGFIEGSLDVLADACEELGMPALLCYGVTERNGGRDEAVRGLAENRRFIESNGRRLVRGLVGVHASFTVTDPTLAEAGALARELGTVVHVHVAEDELDLQHARRLGYESPLERLLRLDALPSGSILAHGVHLTEDEVRRCQELGLWIVQNPRSNRRNGVGYPRALGASRLVALGTDGFPADMVDEAEMLILEASQHEEGLDSATARVNAGSRLFAELFGPDAVEVEVGLRQLVVDGREIVREGILITARLGTLRATARKEASLLWARMEGL